MKKQFVKWGVSLISVFLIITMIGGLFIGNYFYDFAINTKKDIAGLTAQALDTPTIFTPEEKALAYRKAQEVESYKTWLKNTGYTEEDIISFDGLRLHAYAMNNDKAQNKWVIICHGYSSEAMDMVVQAKHFYEKGFHVLMPDARGQGKSEGNYTGMGWLDRKDVIQWAQAIATKYPSAEILFYGLSMGGATVMMAAGEPELPTNVRAVIEDSAYTAIDQEFAYQIRSILGLPPFLIMPFASLITYARAGYWLSEGNVVAQIQKANVPMLFIHGESDLFVPVEMAYRLYDQAPVPKDKLVIPGAGHGTSADKEPEIYWQTIEDFLAQYMPA